MKLKNMCCALAALLVTPMLFAGNTSPMQIAIQDYSARQTAEQSDPHRMYEEVLDACFTAINEMLPATNQQDKDTDQAVKAGFLQLFEHDENSVLTQQEQEIINVLFQDIPEVYNELNNLAQNKDITLRQLEEKQQQIAARADELFGQAAAKIVKNQTTVASDKLNMQRAKQVTASFYMQLVSLSAFAQMGAGMK